MLQLKPFLLVDTPNGVGQAILVINHGATIPLEWVVINNKTGEFESWRTQDIKYMPYAQPFLEPSSSQDAHIQSIKVETKTMIL